MIRSFKKIIIFSSFVFLTSNYFPDATNDDIWTYIKKDQKFLTETIYYEKLKTLDKNRMLKLANNSRDNGEKQIRDHKYNEAAYHFLFSGICFEELEEYDRSGKNLSKAGLYFKQVNNLSLAFACYKKAADNFNREERKKELSPEFYKEAAECAERINDNRIAAKTFMIAGNDYVKINRYEEAAISHEKAGDAYSSVYEIEDDPLMIKRTIESYIEAANCRKRCRVDYGLEIHELLKKSTTKLKEFEDKFSDKIKDVSKHNKLKYDLYFDFFLKQLEINGKMDYELFKKIENIAPEKKYYYRQIKNALEKVGDNYWSERIKLKETDKTGAEKVLATLWIKLRWGDRKNLIIYIVFLSILPFVLLRLNKFKLFELEKDGNKNLGEPRYNNLLFDIACLPNSKIKAQKKFGQVVLSVFRVFFIIFYNLLISKMFS